MALNQLANVIIPSCMVFSPAMVFLLVPVVLIEARALRWFVTPTPQQPRRLAWIANAISTLVGVPAIYFGASPLVGMAMPATFEDGSMLGKLAWLLASGSILGGMQFPDRVDPQWMFWSGAALMHAGFCLGSMLIEWIVIRVMLRGTGAKGIGRAVAIGNVQTYLLLPVGYVGVVVVMMILA